MGSSVRSILVVLVLGCASVTLAQEPDAGSAGDAAADPATEKEPEDKHPRLVKPKGDREDNEQLGGEPSLTETEQGPAAKADGEQAAEEAPPAEEDDCDLDCLEARVEKEEEKEKQKK